GNPSSSIATRTDAGWAEPAVPQERAAAPVAVSRYLDQQTTPGGSTNESEERASTGLSRVAISSVLEQSSDPNEFRWQRLVYRTRPHGCKTQQRAAKRNGAAKAPRPHTD